MQRTKGRAPGQARLRAGVAAMIAFTIMPAFAVDARGDVDVVRFPDSINLNESIRNAAVVPGTARNAQEATRFVGFLMTA